MGNNTRERIFHFVRQRILAGSPPTVREVQEEFAFKSVGTAREHLDRLIHDGCLIKLPALSRGLRLPALKDRLPLLEIPILGQVQAGNPSLAVEDIQGFVPVHTALESSQLFALRVQGESMNQAGIFPGDILIVKRQPLADDGDVVVALIGDEATVKRLHRAKGKIELRPESNRPSFLPIAISGDAVQILGKVIEVRRHL